MPVGSVGAGGQWREVPDVPAEPAAGGAAPPAAVSSLPAGERAGARRVATNLGPAPGTEVVFSGSRWRPVAPVVLLTQNTFMAKTDADANWQTGVSVTLPAGLVGPGTALRCDYMLSCSASVLGAKEIRWLWGGQVVNMQSFGLEQDFRGLFQAQALGANSVQGWWQGGAVVFGASAPAFTQAAVDHSQQQTLAMQFRFAVAGTGSNTLTLRGLKVWLDP